MLPSRSVAMVINGGTYELVRSPTDGLLLGC